MSPADDAFGNDRGFTKFSEEFEHHRRELYARISAYMEEAEIDEAYAARLLLDAAFSMRMSAYGMDVENPSAAGLKLDLDRLRRDVEELLRHAKRGAEAYIRLVKETRAAAEAERGDKPD